MSTRLAELVQSLEGLERGEGEPVSKNGDSLRLLTAAQVMESTGLTRGLVYALGRQGELGAVRVGERGVRLSGGQRQRIGIARALYHDPDLLVFDEATSALDSATEKAVMDAVQRLAGQKTLIMIAHRLSTVEGCDQIIVLDGGRVVGSGTYAELSRTNKAFRRIASATRAV